MCMMPYVASADENERIQNGGSEVVDSYRHVVKSNLVDKNGKLSNCIFLNLSLSDTHQTIIQPKHKSEDVAKGITFQSMLTIVNKVMPLVATITMIVLRKEFIPFSCHFYSL